MKTLVRLLLVAICVGGCFHSRMPSFHARDAATKGFADQVLPGILAVSATYRSHILEKRCSSLSDRWPSVLLKPDPDPEEKYCFGLTYKLNTAPIEQNPALARKLLEDLRMFACAMTPDPEGFRKFTGGAPIADDPYFNGLYKKCIALGSYAIEPHVEMKNASNKGMIIYATTTPMMMLDWALTWHLAVEVLEQEVRIADGGGDGADGETGGDSD